MADDPLSTTFAALADPTRRAILARLAEGDATVNELAEAGRAHRRGTLNLAAGVDAGAHGEY